MKKRMVCLLAALCLLTSCASMLEREYLSVLPHESVSDGDNTLRVESYQGLVNAVLHLVSQGEEHGVIGLHNYTRDVESDLTAACLEITKEDPLGAYAVDYIKHDLVRIVSYYEANVYITYRRTPEQIKNVVSVTGSSAIKGELRDTLAAFAPEAALQVSYLSEDEAYIRQLIRQAYYDTPHAAFGMPEATITLYPDSGYRRLVEIRLTYPEHPEVLAARQEELLTAAAELAAPLRSLKPISQPQALVQTLRSLVSPGQGSTGYHAILEGSADSQGMALACRLLCDLIDRECTVVQGTQNGELRFWNIIATADGYRHLDIFQGGALLTDEEMAADGRRWDGEHYPRCAAAPEKNLEN